MLLRRSVELLSIPKTSLFKSKLLFPNNSFSTSQPFNKVRNLEKWVSSVYHELKPPVANKIMYDEGSLIVQVVGGPNQRDDFHINQGEEFFYQIQGDMQLDVIEKGIVKQIPIREGEIFVLPGGIPHSPQRFKNTIGLVMERKRKQLELDGMRWLVPGTTQSLYEEWFECKDLGTELKHIIKRFNASSSNKTKKPQKMTTKSEALVNTTIECPSPCLLSDLIQNVDTKKFSKNTTEFVVKLHADAGKGPEQQLVHETFFMQIEGYSILHFPITNREMIMRKGDVALLEAGTVVYPECLIYWDHLLLFLFNIAFLFIFEFFKFNKTIYT